MENIINTVSEKISRYKENRENLKNLSVSLRHAVKSGAYPNINSAVIDTYTTEENKEFKTFNQWIKEGKKIIKGSKAFTVWGKPQKAVNKNEVKDFEEFDYFPLCYLFSNAQVQ